MAFPLRDHIGVHVEALGDLDDRLFALDRLEGEFARPPLLWVVGVYLVVLGVFRIVAGFMQPPPRAA